MWHVNYDNMVTIRKKKILRGIPNMKKPEMAMCKQCQIGKMSKRSFKIKSYNYEEVLEPVHTNLCGSIGVKIYSEDIYFILFVDDYSRMMIVIFLRDKSSVF